MCYNILRGDYVTKRKIILVNLIIELVFAVVFFAIYQISVLNNLDVFGDTSTDGGWLPYGFKVNMIFFGWAILSIVISFILWRIKKLNIKLISLLLIAVLLPIITYNINHCFFKNGIILKNTDSSVSYFYCEKFKWLL